LPLAFCQRPTTAGDFAIKSKNNKGTVILIEPDVSVRDALTVLLEGENWRVNCLDESENLLTAIGEGSVAAVISESSLPSGTPQDILERCSRHQLPVIFTGHNLPLQGAVDLIRQGAMDFLDKPFPQSRLLDLLDGLKNRQND
jgi:two-component system response regulator FixJ